MKRPPQEVQHLIKDLRSENCDKKQDAIKRLSERNDAATVKVMIKLLEDSD